MPVSLSHIVRLPEVTSSQSTEVGENIALLTEAVSLSPFLHLPRAFVVKNSFYTALVEQKNQKEKIKELLRKLNGAEERIQKKIISSLQESILNISLPKELEKELLQAFKKEIGWKQNIKISTHIFVDNFSFSHIHTEFTHINNEKEIIKTIKRGLAALFTNNVAEESEARGSEYRDLKVALMIEKIEPIVKSGEIFTFDPATHFDGVTSIQSTFGRAIDKKKEIGHDDFVVVKPTPSHSKAVMISRNLGEKKFSWQVSKRGELERMPLRAQERNSFSLSPDEVVQLSEFAHTVEQKIGPCELQWEKTEKSFVLMRVRKVHLEKFHPTKEVFSLISKGKTLLKGTGLGSKISSGKIRCIEKIRDLNAFQKGDILAVKELVVGIDDCIHEASGLILPEDKKHSSVLFEAREVGIPIVICQAKDFRHLKNGKRVTLEGGCVYEGALPFEVKKEIIPKAVRTKTKIMVNIENPRNAFALRESAADGVGMLRFESLFLHMLPIHPLSLVYYPKIKDKIAKKKIEDLSVGCSGKTEYAVEALASGIARVAAAFSPLPVTVRLSDFASSEFHSLFGASEFKKVNPLHLFNPDVKDETTLQYRVAFGLQCQAIKKVRDEWGLTNVVVMVPFCPTPEQGEEVLHLMKENGLESGKNGLQIHGRCEIPANFILASEFAKIFDGFSLDTKGLEETLQTEAAIHSLVQSVMTLAHKQKKIVSYESETLSHSPEFTKFLIQQGVDSLSFAPDQIKEMKDHTFSLEKTVGRTGNKTHKGFLSLVVGLGMVAATLIGMGSGCSDTLDTKVSVKDINEYVAPAKIREELQKNFQKQIDKFTEEKMVVFSESGFADFRFEYPPDWSMKHESEKLTVTGPSSTDYVSMFVFTGSLLDAASTSTVQVAGKDARVGENVALKGRIAPRVVEVPLSSNTYLILEGGGEKFERILQTVILQE